MLPIDALKDDFSSAVSRGGLLVVTAPTGSGKSTRLPLWLEDDGLSPLLVVEPRRIACRSLAGFLARSRGEEPGGGVGYRVRFEDRTSASTRMMFVTPGVALKMLAEGGAFPFRAVVLDEFHERGWESDLVLTVLRRRGPSVPVVLTSATIDGGALAESLGAVHLHGEGRSFPVEIRYYEGCHAPAAEGLDERVRQVVDGLLSAGGDGDILVFLPGWREICRCRSALGPVAAGYGAELLSVHGSMSVSGLAAALEASGKGRRVILATNVAETSLTIPGVTAVVDSGLVRLKRHRGGRSGLVLEAVAEDSADQRAGRAGRIAPGVCVRLWSRGFMLEKKTPPEVERIELDDCLLNAAACGLDLYDWRNGPWPGRLPGFAVEEAHRRLVSLGAVDAGGNITETGRRLVRLPVDVHQARILAGAPSGMAPVVADICALLQARRRLLRSLKSGPPQRNGTGTGRESVEWLHGCRDEVYAEVAALRKAGPGKDGIDAQALAEARSVASALRRLAGCRVEDPRRDDSALPEREVLAAYLLSRWPEAAFVLRPRALARRKAMAEADGGNLRPPGLSIGGEGGRTGSARTGRGACGDDRPGKGGSGRRRRRGGRSARSAAMAYEPWSNGEMELDVSPHPLWFGESLKVEDIPVAAVILDHEWIGDRGGRLRGRGRMVLPCPVKVLFEAGCGTERVKRIESDGTGIVLVKERVLAGVVLGSYRTVPRGGELRKAVAVLVAEGRLFSRVREQLEEELHLLGLVLSAEHELLPGLSRSWARDLLDSACAVTLPVCRDDVEVSRAEAFVEPCMEDYLAGRLAVLGVEEQGDLELLEAGDLLPGLFASRPELLPALRKLSSEFPAEWEHEGALFRCSVDFGRRRVILLPLNPKARKIRSVPADRLPRLGGLAVFLGGVEGRRLR